MTVDQYELVDLFGRAAIDGNAALFVGAGLSAGAGLPGWDEVLEPARAEVGIPAELEDLPLVAEYYVQNAPGGYEALKHHVLHGISKHGLTPTTGHRLATSLPVQEIWTTNYDPLLEMTCGGQVVAADDDLKTLTRENVPIIKMHGSVVAGPPPAWVTDPVITRTHYETYEFEHPRIWALLRASYLTRTFLFLGFSFEDPNVGVLLRLARLHGTAASDRHLTVLKRPSDAADVKLHDLRVRDLEASGVTVCEIDDFAALQPLLRALVLRTRPPRLFLSGSGEPDELLPWCEKVGSAVADELKWHLTSLAGDVGWLTTRHVARLRRADRTYQPEQLLLNFRARAEPAPPLDERVGTAIYTDLDREALAHTVLDGCRAMLVIAGGDRTLEEVGWAVERGLGVIPLAASGGSALAVWEAIGDDIPLLGGRDASPDDWKLLNSPDQDVAIRAAVRLVQQAMYMIPRA
jgi:hypothetical protein